MARKKPTAPQATSRMSPNVETDTESTSVTIDNTEGAKDVGVRGKQVVFPETAVIDAATLKEPVTCDQGLTHGPVSKYCVVSHN